MIRTHKPIIVSKVDQIAWLYNNFRQVYKNNEPLDYVHCTDCGHVLHNRDQTGDISLLRHRCYRKRKSTPSCSQSSIISSTTDSYTDCIIIESDHPEPVPEQLKESANMLVNDRLIGNVPDAASNQSGDNNNNAKISPPKQVNPSTVLAWNIPKWKISLAQREILLRSFDLRTSTAFTGEGFQKLAKQLIQLGQKMGPMNAFDVLSDADTIHMDHIYLNILTKQKTEQILACENVILSCDIWTRLSNSCQYSTLTGHFIDENFILQKRVLGTKLISGTIFETNQAILMQYQTDLQKHLQLLNCQMMVNLNVDSRNACVLTILNNIVNESLADPLLAVNDTINQIRNICNFMPFDETKFELSNLLYKTDSSKWGQVWHVINAVRQCDFIKKTDLTENIDNIHNLLKPFERAFQGLASHDTPTVNLVSVSRKHLLDYLQVTYKGEPSSLRIVKNKMVQSITQYFIVSDIQNIATFLDPRYKSLNCLNESERLQVYVNINNIQQDKQMIIQDEIQRYISEKWTGGIVINPLEYWRDQNDLPCLQEMARRIFKYPASVAADVRLFEKDAIKVTTARQKVEVQHLHTALVLAQPTEY